MFGQDWIILRAGLFLTHSSSVWPYEGQVQMSKTHMRPIRGPVQPNPEISPVNKWAYGNWPMQA